MLSHWSLLNWWTMLWAFTLVCLFEIKSINLAEKCVYSSQKHIKQAAGLDHQRGWESRRTLEPLMTTSQNDGQHINIDTKAYWKLEWSKWRENQDNSMFTFSALPNILISINSIWLETTWIAFQGIQFISSHIFWESNPWPSYLMLSSTVLATRTIEQTWMLLSQLYS